eukprot:scaffold318994_cov169-Cyclotella_meneghiniana.AAC.1
MSYNRFGRRSENDERYFLFVYSGGTPVPFRVQQELLQYVQGTHPVLEKYPDIKCRRIAEWYKWATNSGGRSFHQLDLPVIAHYYRQYWDIGLPDNGTISALNLDRVKNEIRCLLEVCGLIPVYSSPSIIQRTSLRIRGANAIESGGDATTLDRRVRRRSNERRPDSEDAEMEDSSSDNDADESESSYIDYGVLKKQWFEQRDYSYVGSLEVAAKEAYRD